MTRYKLEASVYIHVYVEAKSPAAAKRKARHSIDTLENLIVPNYRHKGTTMEIHQEGTKMELLGEVDKEGHYID